MRRGYSLLALLALATSAACEHSAQLTSPEGLLPRFEIADGAHGTGGDPHFFFHPPIGPSREYTGGFDPSLSPVVEICAWSGTECSLPLLARYSMEGRGAERVRVVPEDEQYIVNWNTRQFNLDLTKTYRIRVLDGGLELGHADVDVIQSGSEKSSVNTQQYVPVVLGQTLPIKFRVEQGALAGTKPRVVSFGIDVTGTMRSHVGEICSAVACVPPTGSSFRLRIPESGMRPFILAMNAAGDPILVALAREGNSAEISVRGTGFLLPRLFFGPRVRMGVPASAVEDAILNHPSFSNLLGTLETLAESGQTFLISDAAATATSALIDVGLSVLPSISTSATPSHNGTVPEKSMVAAVVTGPASMAPYPVSVRDTIGTDYNLVNSAYIYFSANSRNANGKESATLLEARDIKLFSLKPQLGDPTNNLLVGDNGAVSVTVGQSELSKNRNWEKALTIGLEVFADIIHAPYGFVDAALVELATPEKLRQISTEPATAAADVIGEMIKENSRFFLEFYVAAWVAAPNIDKGLQIIRMASWIHKLAKVASLAERAPFWHDWYIIDLTSLAPKTITICQKDGVFVWCDWNVQIAPRSATVQVGQSISLTATVRAGDGELSEDPLVFWDSRDFSTASASGSRKIGTVTGNKPGKAWIVASSGGASDSVLVTVTQGEGVIVGDYVLTGAPVVLKEAAYGAGPLLAEGGTMKISPKPIWWWPGEYIYAIELRLSQVSGDGIKGEWVEKQQGCLVSSPGGFGFWPRASASCTVDLDWVWYFYRSHSETQWTIRHRYWGANDLVFQKTNDTP